MASEISSEESAAGAVADESGAEERDAAPRDEALRVVTGAPPGPQQVGSVWWRILGILETMRPHQWVKNVFVLAPVVFAKEIFDPLLLYRAAGAFGVFCLLAGAVYTINDMADVEADRLHPVKRHRPIPSGRVPIPLARGAAVVLVLAALGGALLAPSNWFAVVAFSYFAMNLAYSFKLKNVAYLDVGIIAAGFVLRVTAGGFATNVTLSSYLIVCTALLALFLGFGKRRHELGAEGRKAKQRSALETYSVRGLDVALGLTAAATIATYLAYTLDPHTMRFFGSEYLWPSTAFVIAGVWRFLYLVRNRPDSESPTQEMLKDGPFVAIVLLWVMLMGWVVYSLRPGG